MKKGIIFQSIIVALYTIGMVVIQVLLPDTSMIIACWTCILFNLAIIFKKRLKDKRDKNEKIQIFLKEISFYQILLIIMYTIRILFKDQVSELTIPLQIVYYLGAGVILLAIGLLNLMLMDYLKSEKFNRVKSKK